MELDLTPIIEGMAHEMASVMEMVLAERDPWYSKSNLVNELQTAVTENEGSLFFELTANYYITWLDEGRPPTRDNAELSDFYIRLTDWCIRRGFGGSNAVVYPIYKKIHEHGYEGKHFLQDWWDEMENTFNVEFDNLFEEICTWLAKEVFYD